MKVRSGMLSMFNSAGTPQKAVLVEPENIIQIVTGDEVTIGNCFPDVWEILPDAKGGG